MKVVGLITEYNPFHNGHQYHIEKAKEITGADTVIAVMSGNYVQRGTSAIMPKHLRTKVALEAGVSVVIELPVCYASASAEYFAKGAVSLLEQLHCVDAICFGSECGDIDLLSRLAHIIADEPTQYKSLLQAYLKKGVAFPLARANALKEFLNEDSLSTILDQPNNILGMEYIKAIYQLKSTLQPYTIKRKVSGYHDTELSETYSSASAIRRLLAFSGNALHLEEGRPNDEPALTDILSRLEEQVPSSCIQLLEENYRIRYPIYSNDFSLILKYKLLSESKESLATYFDVSEELANRITNNLNDYISFDQFCDLLKTRELTYTRISRSLFHILLSIKKSDIDMYQKQNYHQYIHILGFRKDATHVLSLIKETTSLPMLTKLTDTSQLNEAGIHMLASDIFASDLYESVVTDKFKFPFINEYEKEIIRLEL